MAIGVVDRKLLWGRAGNRCAWTDCGARLTADLRSPESHVLRDHGAVLGEEAHIRSKDINGPRFDPAYPEDKLDTYANLVLLCERHHGVIDKKNGTAWPTSEVDEIKRKHEEDVDRALDSLERGKRDLDERMAARLQVWEIRSQVNDWESVTWQLNGPHPKLHENYWEALFDLAAWLLKLQWPRDYPKLAIAIEQYRRVLVALLGHLRDIVDKEKGWYKIERQHKQIDWNPSLYTDLLSTYNVNANVVRLLMIELTRALNLVITAISEEFDPLYRFDDGYALVASGDLVFGQNLSRLEYEPVRWLDFPFDYDSQALLERVRSELNGGDPREPGAINLYEVDVAEWSHN
jgi:hypothetical protein